MIIYFRCPKLLRYQWIEDVTVKLSTAVHYGSDKFVLQVETRGEKDGRFYTHTAAIVGNGQSRATGLATAQVVERLLFEEFLAGVFHSEQLFEPLSFIQQLVGDDLVFYENVPTREDLS